MYARRTVGGIVTSRAYPHRCDPRAPHHSRAIEIERGEFTRYVELHGTADEPVDGAAAIAEDGAFGIWSSSGCGAGSSHPATRDDRPLGKGRLTLRSSNPPPFLGTGIPMLGLTQESPNLGRRSGPLMAAASASVPARHNAGFAHWRRYVPDDHASCPGTGRVLAVRLRCRHALVAVLPGARRAGAGGLDEICSEGSVRRQVD